MADKTDTIEVRKWLVMLMAPGSSLGGARPKANIQDEHGHPWIAKFPSKNDTIDKVGLSLTEVSYQKLGSKKHWFYEKKVAWKFAYITDIQ